MVSFELILEGLIIAFAISVDGFVSGFAYGTNRIKIPFKSALIITLFCSVILGLALFLGSYLSNFVPKNVTLIICVSVLIFLGLIKIFDFIIKSLIKRRKGINKEIKFSFFNFKFILHIMAKPEEADINGNKVLSAREAVALALALSLDGFTVGVGAGLTDAGAIVFIIMICFSLVATLLLLMSGLKFGSRIAKKTPLNLSWLSGLMLIIIAIIKLFV